MHSVNRRGVFVAQFVPTIDSHCVCKKTEGKMEKYKVKYDSVLGKLFNNLNIHHLADSVNGYVRECDEHTINQVVLNASARAFLWLQRFCGKDGRVRAFNQIMGDNGIANYNVDWDDTNYFLIHYESSIGFSH